MKLIKLLVCIFVLSLLVGCAEVDTNNSNNLSSLNTGAQGSVEYGIGDCMPNVNIEDPSNSQGIKTYSPFSGEIYFIVKDKLDSLGEGNFEELIESSAKTFVTNGNYEINLTPGEYVVMPRDVYRYGGNFIHIFSGELIEQDFQFFKCTSY